LFTGLVETTGRVTQVARGRKSVRLGVVPRRSPYDVAVGSSVSVSGVCLTVEKQAGGTVVFTAVHETLRRSTLEKVRQGGTVNLERALRMSDRLEGHFVLGHVDGVGRVTAAKPEGDSVLLTVSVPDPLRRFVVEKGSVALDGVSLTVVSVAPEGLVVSLVPHTLANTTLAGCGAGDSLNIEVDVLARYLAGFLREGGARGTDGERAAGESLYAKLEALGF
jgi:riboflavin synthase